MAEEMTITIDKQGGTEIKVTGCAGPGCSDLTRGIEKALGTTTNDSKTSEYYAETEQAQQKLGR